MFLVIILYATLYLILFKNSCWLFKLESEGDVLTTIFLHSQVLIVIFVQFYI
uniref:Uncharacterized protein n=1 Tax=Heterorhabditis bacteriophora TaxID=37862 RepID=A0A1I7WB71_HETBA